MCGVQIQQHVNVPFCLGHDSVFLHQAKRATWREHQALDITSFKRLRAYLSFGQYGKPDIHVARLFDKGSQKGTRLAGSTAAHMMAKQMLDGCYMIAT